MPRTGRASLERKPLLVFVEIENILKSSFRTWHRRGPDKKSQMTPRYHRGHRHSDIVQISASDTDACLASSPTCPVTNHRRGSMTFSISPPAWAQDQCSRLTHLLPKSSQTFLPVCQYPAQTQPHLWLSLHFPRTEASSPFPVDSPHCPLTSITQLLPGGL